MTRDEILKVIRECEDHLVEIGKVLAVFDANENWHKSYDDVTRNRIDLFNHFDLDPRVIAWRGNDRVRKMQEKLREAWGRLMDDLRAEERASKESRKDKEAK